MIVLHILLFSCSILQNYPVHSESKCPDKIGQLRRVGNTRYFINHPINKRTNYTTFEEAKQECKENKLEMGTVTSLISLAVLGRELEQMAFREKLKDTWYWLDAKYDDMTGAYFWGKGKKRLDFTLYLYRDPRPIGIGTHITYKNKYVGYGKHQCLAVALPWFGSADLHKHSKIFYGHHLTFDERDCQSKKKRHTICESQQKECKTPSKPFELAENKVTEDYFNKGNWIFGNRKYIVNWGQRNAQDSKKYCESLGLQVFTPSTHERELIPHIKMWSRGITASQFWTSFTYDVENRQFNFPNGTLAVKHFGWTNFTEIHFRAAKDRPTLCVVMSLVYEFKEQMPCTNVDSKDCTWSFIRYAPANCDNFHGAICQHKDYDKRTIEWYKNFKSNMSGVLKASALTQEFGNLNNNMILRSKYKQTFGICYCPKGHRMVRANNTKLLKKSTEKNEFFKYDYSETYWVVDKDGFNKTVSSKCTVISMENKEWKPKTVDCTEYHFYLCENISKKPTKAISTNSFSSQPSYNWGIGAQPRRYPVLKERVQGCAKYNGNSCGCRFPVRYKSRSNFSVNCEYNVVSNNCVRRQAECSSDSFSSTECKRGGDHVFYTIGGEVCKSKVPSGNCKFQEVIFAVKFSRNNVTVKDSRSITYKPGDAQKFKGNSSNCLTDFGGEEIGGVPNADLQLYINYLRSYESSKKPTRCFTFPIQNRGDGQYEISLKTAENYKNVQDRNFDILFNNQFLVKTYTMESYRKVGNGVELNANFRILNAGKSIEIKGHPVTQIQGNVNQIELNFCTSSCDFDFTRNLFIFAISVVKF